MMITSGLTNVFKIGLLSGEFDFSAGTSQVFNIALYTDSAVLGPATTTYSTLHEASGIGYTAGGEPLTVSVTPTQSENIAYLSFSDVTWGATSITARGALIYKLNGATNPAIATIDFGGNKTTSGGNFVVQFPIADNQNAIIRIG